MRNDYDAVDDGFDEEGFDGDGLRWMSIVVVLLVVFGFFSLAWYAYRVGSLSYDGEEVMFVEADSTPIREKPENPGGTEFPHQDKEIYETLTLEERGKRITQYLEDSEEKPMAERDTDVAASTKKSTDANGTEVIELKEEKTEAKATVAKVKDNITFMKTGENPAAATEDDIMSVVDEYEAKAAAQGESAKKFMPEKKVEVAKKAVKKATPKPAAKKVVKKTVKKKATPKKVSKSGKYQVQLAALRSYGEAQNMWKKLSKKHSSVLNGYSSNIIKADVPGKGTFYRLRAKGYATRTAAKSACAKLKSRGQSCLVP